MVRSAPGAGTAAGRRASRAHAIAAKLRLRSAAGRDQAQATVQRITGELAGLAELAVRDTQRLLANARRALRRAAAKATNLAAAGGCDPAVGRRRGRLRRAVHDLVTLIDAAGQIAAQTRQRVAGITPQEASRRVSLHDGDARPIAKGRLGKPVEFGSKAQVLDNEDGVVLDHSVQQGNPPDAPQLASPSGRTGHPPHRAPSSHRHSRPWLRRETRRGRPPRPRGRCRCDPPQGQTRQGPTTSNTGRRSAKR